MAMYTGRTENRQVFQENSFDRMGKRIRRDGETWSALGQTPSRNRLAFSQRQEVVNIPEPLNHGWKAKQRTNAEQCSWGMRGKEKEVAEDMGRPSCPALLWCST